MAKQTWHIAASLETLRAQLNKAFPKRSKISDGGIGNAEHSARASDHNPNENHAVCARDFTHDPSTGIDCQWLADTLVKNKDPRVKYIIWNRQICAGAAGPSAWKWRAYSGKNGHTHHLHLSVMAAPKLAESTTEWDLDFPDNTKANDIAKGIISAAPPTPAVKLPQTSSEEPGGKSDTAADLSAPVAGLSEIPVSPPNKTDVVIEKEPDVVEVKPTGVLGPLWQKVTTALGGDVTANIAIEKAQQAQALGLSADTWRMIFYAITAGLVIWIGYHFVVAKVIPWGKWIVGRIRTNQLVAGNANADSTQVIESSKLAEYEALGYTVVRRS